MTSKNSGMNGLENLAQLRDPSRRFRREAPSGIGGVGHVGGVGNMNTDAADPPSEAVLTRAVAEQSPPRGGLTEEEPEYEVSDLIYERTGTLLFPCPSRVVESSGRAPEAAGAKPEAKGAPSVGSESSAWSSLVRDLRAASAGTPGVSMLATVDVGGEGPASTAKRSEPSTPPALAEAKAGSRSLTGIFQVAPSPRTVPQEVAPGPAIVAPGPSSALANRALGKVAQTFVATPSPPASRDVDASRGLEALEARSFAPVPNAKRNARPSRLVKQYPSLGQRVLAEVRRTAVAKKIAAVGVVAAAGVVAAVVVASSTLMPGRVPREEVASRSSVTAPAAERAPAPPRAHIEPPVPVGMPEAPPEPPNSTPTDGTPLPIPEETLPEPSSRRAPASKVGQGKPIHDRALPTRPNLAKPCDCLPGDPLCGCLD
jgi:hypothetical protein